MWKFLNKTVHPSLAYSGPKALKQRKKKFPAFLLTFDVISVVMNSDAADLTSAFFAPAKTDKPCNVAKIAKTGNIATIA